MSDREQPSDDRVGPDGFDDTDVSTLTTFAAQAAIALDNVRLHEEAQRLSLTDPLTGLHNRRAWDQDFAVGNLNRQLASLLLRSVDGRDRRSRHDT